MALVNRDKDISEQKETLSYNLQLAGVTGGTYVLGILPYPCEIKQVVIAAKALSGAPSCEVEGYKFVAGAGVTINSAIMPTIVVKAFGISGYAQSVSLGVAGSTQVQLNTGDALVATITGANTAADNLVVDVVVAKLQDIVSLYGSAT